MLSLHFTSSISSHPSSSHDPPSPQHTGGTGRFLPVPPTPRTTSHATFSRHVTSRLDLRASHRRASAVCWPCLAGESCETSENGGSGKRGGFRSRKNSDQKREQRRGPLGSESGWWARHPIRERHLLNGEHECHVDQKQRIGRSTATVLVVLAVLLAFPFSAEEVWNAGGQIGLDPMQIWWEVGGKERTFLFANPYWAVLESLIDSVVSGYRKMAEP